MPHVASGKKWLVLPIYLLAGFALGLGDPHFGRCLQQLGVKPGLATAASVNLVLPVLAILLAIVSARVPIALLGAVCMSAGLFLGLAAAYNPKPWDAATLLSAVPPVLVLAGVGYAVIGTITVLVSRAFASR